MPSGRISRNVGVRGAKFKYTTHVFSMLNVPCRSIDVGKLATSGIFKRATCCSTLVMHRLHTCALELELVC